MSLRALEKRMARLEGGVTVLDPEALACWLEADQQPEVQAIEQEYGELLESVFAKQPGDRLTDAEDTALAMAWRALWVAAHRLAEERGISIWRVNTAQYKHSKRRGES